MMIPIDAALKLAGGGRPDYLESLYRYAGKVSSPALIVEVGCMYGDSTIMMGCAIKGSLSQIVTIDPVFQTGVRWSNEPPRGLTESSLIVFLARVSAAYLDGYISVIPYESWSVLPRWDKPIDLLFIDGEHTYDAVRRDCEWLTFVKSGGYAVFDDWMEPVERAVQEYLLVHPEWTILHESTDAPSDGMVVTLLQKSN